MIESTLLEWAFPYIQCKSLVCASFFALQVQTSFGKCSTSFLTHENEFVFEKYAKTELFSECSIVQSTNKPKAWMKSTKREDVIAEPVANNAHCQLASITMFCGN